MQVEPGNGLSLGMIRFEFGPRSVRKEPTRPTLGLSLDMAIGQLDQSRNQLHYIYIYC